jgi:hypothetical protein
VALAEVVAVRRPRTVARHHIARADVSHAGTVPLVLVDSLIVDPDRLASETGWRAKPEGLCKGDICVPAPDAVRSDGLLDAEVVARRLGMPLVRDETRGLWALGPSTIGGRALQTADAPELTLPDRSGDAFSLASLLGRRVVMVAWASW